MSNNGLAQFFGEPEAYFATHAEQEDLSLSAPDMTRDEARSATDNAKTNLTKAKRELLDIKRRKGWQALGYKSWERYVENEFSVFRQALDQQLKAEEAKETLAETLGEKTAYSLPDAQAIQLAKAGEKAGEVYEKAQEIVKNAPPPVGKAALYHKPGKLTANVIQQAMAETAEPQSCNNLLQTAETDEAEQARKILEKALSGDPNKGLEDFKFAQEKPKPVSIFATSAHIFVAPFTGNLIVRLRECRDYQNLVITPSILREIGFLDEEEDEEAA